MEKDAMRYVIKKGSGSLNDIMGMFGETTMNKLISLNYIKTYINFNSNDPDYKWKCTKECKVDYKILYGRLSIMDILFGLFLKFKF